MAAKGNSGVILSTIVRGMARVLGEQEQVDGEVLARRRSAAGRRARTRPSKIPVEGTMLTVIREMAEEAERPRGARAARRRGARARDRRAATTPSRRTPELLDKLRESGVVDAGGAGLVELSARRPPRSDRRAAARRRRSVTEELTEESIHHEESEFRYCTVFLVEGDELDLDALHARLEPLGDSLLVTGDASIAKVHVHTDEPESALAVGRAVGVVDEARVEIGDMHSQAAERERWLAQLHAAAQAPPARGRARRRRPGRRATATSCAAKAPRS